MTTAATPPRAPDLPDRYIWPSPPPMTPSQQGPLHPTNMAVTGLLAGRAGFTPDRLRAHLAKLEAITTDAAQRATMATTTETLALVQDVRVDALNAAYQAVLNTGVPGARFFANKILALMQQPAPIPR
jgi:hypothetical protein